MSTEKLKDQIKKISSDKVKVVLFILIVVSLVFNILLLTNSAHAPILKEANDNYQESQTVERTPEINNEYTFGTKHESYRKYENGEWKTYSNTTALEEHEIEDIRKEFQERQRLMHEHFKKQRELMDEIWESFYR
jgi:DUF4097 and DUF4098 domain-containing protein YvlB